MESIYSYPALLETLRELPVGGTTIALNYVGLQKLVNQMGRHLGGEYECSVPVLQGGDVKVTITRTI